MIKLYRNSRKAFTLIELLEVIVILAIIALIITPVITDVIKKARESSDLRSAEAYVKAGDNFYAEATLDSNKSSLLGTNVINSLEVNNAEATGTLIVNSDGTVAMAIVLNNKCYVKTSSQYVDQITVSDDTTNCTVSNENNYKTYSNGEAVYFNVSTGKTCLASEAVSTTNTKTGCMKFYAFGDSSTSKTVNMILDHNTTANNVNWAASVNTAGPDKTSGYAYYQLLQDTNSWVGVETQSNYTYTNSSTSYTVKYGDDNAKVRFITANEIATITGNTSWNSNTKLETDWFYLDSNSQTQTAKSIGASKYAWLYDYTYQCTQYGCNAEDNTSYNSNYAWGYWISDAVSGGSSNAWIVHQGGNLDNSNVTNTFYGVRPVITVSKSNL